MTEILTTKPLVAALEAQIAQHAQNLPSVPQLQVIMVGDNSASQLYVKHKQAAALKVGIDCTIHTLDVETPQDTLEHLITRLAAKAEVTGILLQLPLPAHLNAPAALNSIPAQKDVDGLTAANQKNLTTNTRHLQPATPLGIMRILHWAQTPLEGAQAVVLGESQLVGAPTAKLLTAAGANVQTFNSTSDITTKHTAMRMADIIVSAAGCPDLVTPENTSPHATVIDVGINRKPDGTLTGDSSNLTGHVAALTPVPGGVGPMTVCSLLTNIIDAATWQADLPAIDWEI